MGYRIVEELLYLPSPCELIAGSDGPPSGLVRDDGCCCCCCSATPPLLKPNHSPILPPGFGTGHSLPTLASLCASSSICRNVDTSSSALGSEVEAGEGACVTAVVVVEVIGSPIASASGLGSFRLFRRILCTCCPSAVIIMVVVSAESAKVRRGAGHGKRCGKPTTTKETPRVAANKDRVDRDRGWRCGGILTSHGVDERY